MDRPRETSHDELLQLSLLIILLCLKEEDCLILFQQVFEEWKTQESIQGSLRRF